VVYPVQRLFNRVRPGFRLEEIDRPRAIQSDYFTSEPARSLLVIGEYAVSVLGDALQPSHAIGFHRTQRLAELLSARKGAPRPDDSIKLGIGEPPHSKSLKTVSRQ
jgi:hypothetical protein